MTVRDLIDLLRDVDDLDAEVVMQPSNSIYVDDIFSVEFTELRAFYGDDKEVYVLTSDGQVGAV